MNMDVTYQTKIIPPNYGGRICQPHHNDVLSGRGGAVNSHKGNVQFRNLVFKMKDRYLAPGLRKLEKVMIAEHLVMQIRTLNPPGRFLKQANGGWYEIGDEKARRKCGQAIRDLTEKATDTSKDIPSSIEPTTFENNVQEDQPLDGLSQDLYPTFLNHGMGQPSVSKPYPYPYPRNHDAVRVSSTTSMTPTIYPSNESYSNCASSVDKHDHDLSRTSTMGHQTGGRASSLSVSTNLKEDLSDQDVSYQIYAGNETYVPSKLTIRRHDTDSHHAHDAADQHSSEMLAMILRVESEHHKTDQQSDDNSINSNVCEMSSKLKVASLDVSTEVEPCDTKLEVMSSPITTSTNRAAIPPHEWKETISTPSSVSKSSPAPDQDRTTTSRRPRLCRERSLGGKRDFNQSSELPPADEMEDAVVERGVSSRMECSSTSMMSMDASYYNACESPRVFSGSGSSIAAMKDIIGLDSMSEAEFRSAFFS